MTEQSLGTIYNVEKDLANWARIKVEGWDPQQRDAIQREFTRRDREFHSERCRKRRESGGAGKADH